MGIAAGQTLNDTDTAAMSASAYMAEVKRTTTIGSITTTETVVDSVTFTAVAGRRYKITWTGNYESTVAGDTVQLRLRWSPGATVGITGTPFRGSRPPVSVASRGTPGVLIETVAGIPAGQVTVVATMFRSAGTGTVTAAAISDNEATLLIEDIGT